MSKPRIAILGMHLESNALAPVTTGADFRASCYLVEVDAGGLVSPIVSRIRFAKLPLPDYPLDLETTWTQRRG